eukprot:TRINITY_DN25204_c0_g1_i1.p1 TRINITY_DN25204_c0_g1~~TRINITY_DN25204_c0_g1_i1.p1  ORF type:complete len:752 (+),score=177.90 TRINITY_DN25204_c0_g1_i1:248-2257(+)
MGSADTAARYKHCAQVAGEALYIHGGFGMGNAVHGDMWCYSHTAEAWSFVLPRGDVPGARAGHASVFYKGLIYIYGGWTAQGVKNDLFTFNPHDQFFRCVSAAQPQYVTLGAGAPTPSHRRDCRLVAHKHVVYVLGGRAVGKGGSDNWGGIMKGWHVARQAWVARPTAAGRGWGIAREKGLADYCCAVLTHWPVEGGSGEGGGESDAREGHDDAADGLEVEPMVAPSCSGRRCVTGRVSVSAGFGITRMPPPPPVASGAGCRKLRRFSTFPAPRAPLEDRRLSFTRGGTTGAAQPHGDHPWVVLFGCGGIFMLHMDRMEMHYFTAKLPHLAVAAAAAVPAPGRPHVVLMHGGKALAGAQSTVLSVDLHAPCFLAAFQPHPPGDCAAFRTAAVATATMAAAAACEAAAARRRKAEEEGLRGAFKKPPGVEARAALPEEWRRIIDDMGQVYTHAKAKLDAIEREHGLAVDPAVYHHAASIHGSRARFNYCYTGFTDAKEKAAREGHAAVPLPPAKPTRPCSAAKREMDPVFRNVVRSEPADYNPGATRRHLHPRELMAAQHVDEFDAVSKAARDAYTERQGVKNAQRPERIAWRDVKTTDDVIQWFNFRRGVIEKTPFRPAGDNRQYLNVSGYPECVTFPNAADPSVSRVTNQVDGMPWRYSYRRAKDKGA